MNYRVPCWNFLADKYDFTAGFFSSDQTNDRECKFKKIKFKASHVGPFDVVKGVRRVAKEFDAVILIDDFHIPIYCILPFLPHKYKILNWGIGFRVSYTLPFLPDRKHTFLDDLEEIILKRCDALIFYMERAKDFWRNTGLDMNNVFCAPNTAGVLPIECNPIIKKNFLFIGTLYRGKGIDLLIKSFAEAKKIIDSDVKLDIVGGGELKDDLYALVESMGLTTDINFVGPVYDEKVLAQYFQRALLCISPTQGGLSCPKSMGYGVPFVTRKDAITGGEIYHMTPGVNGIMYDKDTDLVNILVDALQNKEKYLKMGKMAKDYYDNNATPQFKYDSRFFRHECLLKQTERCFLA